MKVLVISGAFPPMPFAEAGHTLHLCQELAQRGVDVHLLTTRGAVTDGLPFNVHPIMRDWSWADLPRLLRFLKQCSPDAVLTIYIGFIYNDHPMVTFAATICKLVLPGVPFAAQFENVMGAATGRCSAVTRGIRRLVKWWAGSDGVDYEFGTLLRDSDRVIVLCGQHEARLAQIYPAIAKKRVFVPPPPTLTVRAAENGGARQAGRELLKVKPDDFVLLYFGYIYPSKGLETLLRAFHLARSRGSNPLLVIAGGVPAHLYEQRLSYLKELQELATTLGIEKEVVWTGEWEWDRGVESLYLHAADVCILPFDGGVAMSNSTFAAATAHGLPIISTHGKIIEEFFLHGENVFLCPPRDPEALAAAIQALMDRPELRARLAAGALAMSREWFSWDRAVERVVATLKPDR
jgi:glycosyltransferase involved in cell wall biosynthesis